MKTWPGFRRAVRGEGWVCDGGDGVVWQKKLGKLTPALAPPVPRCPRGALCARLPRSSCTSCSWPKGQVLLILPFVHQSFCLLGPGPLSPHPLHKEKGLKPGCFPHSTLACHDTHPAAPQSPGRWLHWPSGSKSTAEHMLGFLFREQDWGSLPVCERCSRALMVPESGAPVSQ